MEEEYNNLGGCGQIALWIGIIGLFGVIVTLLAGG